MHYFGAGLDYACRRSLARGGFGVRTEATIIGVSRDGGDRRGLDGHVQRACLFGSMFWSRVMNLG